MAFSLEPQSLQDLLAPIQLDLQTLIEQPPAYQVEVIRFLLPEDAGRPDGQQAEVNAGLPVLGWAVGRAALQAEKPSKSLLGALFELFLALGEPGPAGFIFDRLYPEPETQVTYYSRQIRLLLAAGDPQQTQVEAQAVLAEMREAHPDRYTTHISGAEIAIREGDWPAAAEYYRQALEGAPQSLAPVLGLAGCAAELGDRPEAARRLEQAAAFDRLSWTALLRIAGLWQKLGEHEQAGRFLAAARAGREQQLAHLVETLTPVQTGSADEDGLELIGEPARPAEGAGLEPAAHEALKEYFGHEEFRPGQETIIAQALAGRDSLAVLPTGAGKSLCYQLPALLLPGPVLVLSPLISLMKDQFDKLPPALQEHTLIINSSLEPGEAARRLREVARPGNQVRLIYAAPERLRQRPFVLALQRAGLALLVVDEAHCVTMWGNDFRPDYLFIHRALLDLEAAGQRPALLALTATATPPVAVEIGQQLGRELAVVRGSVFRPNLRFGVEKVAAGSETRMQRVAELCARLPGSGIIYARSREKCEELAAYLNRQGLKARYYHAGMDAEQRHQVQESWSHGRTPIVAATIAFGMGIDKANVRYIIHFNPPASLENYMQEAGRAGRDGQPAECLLLYSSGDKGNLTRWLREERESLNLDNLRIIYRNIAGSLGRARRGVVPLESLLRGFYDSPVRPDETQLRVGLSLLERAGLLERGYDLPASAEVGLGLWGQTQAEPDPDFERLVEAVGLRPGLEQTVDLVKLAGDLGLAPPELEARLLLWAEAGRLNYSPGRREMYIELKEAGGDTRQRLEGLLNQMQVEADRRVDLLEGYLQSRVCRQVLLARHFGERLPQACGICDNCQASSLNGPAVNHLKKARPASKAAGMAEPEAYGLILGCLNLITGGGEAVVGRSGLVRLLMGQPSAIGTRANNPFKGSLEGKVKVKEAEGLVERLIEQGLIEERTAQRAAGGTYRALKVSPAGYAWLEANLAHS